MDTSTSVQFLGKAVCILHSINTVGKGMNPTILPPAMGRLGSLTLYDNQSRRRKIEFKLVKLCLRIDFVSHPAHMEGLDKYIFLIN